MPISRNSSRPTTSHRTHSSRSSLAPSTRRASNPTSRRSSFLLQPVARAYNIRPAISNRAASAGYIHLHDNPFLPHNSTDPHSQPPVLSNPQHSTFPTTSSTHQHIRSPSLPSFPPPPLSPTQTRQPSYSNYVPATTIDWTLPSTRRKDYEKIDRSCRGIRGLWRKVVPRWCCKSPRVGFFDEKGEEEKSDAGSVRRYRLDLAHEDGEDIGDEDDGQANKDKSRPALEGKRATSGWSCWGLKNESSEGCGSKQNI